MSEQSSSNDSSSAGTVEKAIKLAKEKVRTLVIATRELHGFFVDFERVVLACTFRWTDHFLYF